MNLEDIAAKSVPTSSGLTNFQSQQAQAFPGGFSCQVAGLTKGLFFPTHHNKGQTYVV